MAFGLTSCGDRQAELIQASADNAVWFSGDSVTIPGLRNPCGNRSSVFAGHVATFSPSNITFGLVMQGGITLDEDYEVCISDRTGRATISLLPMIPVGTYGARLVARDGLGGVVSIASWDLVVHSRASFNPSNSECAVAEHRQLRATVGHRSAVPGAHERGTTVIVQGFNTTVCVLEDLFDNYRVQGGVADVTFKLHVTTTDTENPQASSLGPDTFVNSDTGKLSLKLDNLGRHTVVLQAESGPDRIDLVQWDMHIREGPNSGPCTNDGVPADSDSDVYACRCLGGFTGDNCELLPAVGAASSGTDAGDSVVTGASLGGVLFLIAVVAIAFRVQGYRRKHQPADMKAMQGEVLEGLGMALPKNIGDHEFGLSLSMRTEVELDVKDPALLAPAPAFQKRLVAALSKAVPRVATELQRARVSVSRANRTQVVVVIPRPRGDSKASDVAERAAATVATCIRKKRLDVGANAVDAVFVAVPRRIPRELHRRQLTRIARLGAGAFGEVFLYQVVEEKQRGVPPYKVAAKTVKPGASVGRDELLKEAALMALMEHHNVVALVGVVTAPHDLPALILLEYCEGGELREYVTNDGLPDKLTTTTKLTFAAQIALGMQYIAARNIVHRDLAARNVLLDGTGKCKVADFGMSTSLIQQGKTYAAKYVQLHEEVALRWTSPEALQHEKFSVASDVWAYGITVWEIFSGGNEPYGDQGLGEVGAFVKGGGRLWRPNEGGCPVQLFDELMASCWAADPSERPAFGELYDVAVRHGALEDGAIIKKRAKIKKARSLNISTAAQRSGDRAHLAAPSVHYMQAKLAPAVAAAVQPIADANAAGFAFPGSRSTITDVGMATSYEVKDRVVLPRTAALMCKRDHQQGAIYVDTLSGANDVGSATAILSCKAPTLSF